MTVCWESAISIVVQFVGEIFPSLRTVGDILEKSISGLTKKVVHIVQQLLPKETWKLISWSAKPLQVFRLKEINIILILGDASKYVEKLDFKSFRCGLCGKTFSDRSNCTRHVRINHLGEVREADTKQPCIYCGKYLVKRTIPNHVRNSCPKAPLHQN